MISFYRFIIFLVFAIFGTANFSLFSRGESSLIEDQKSFLHSDAFCLANNLPMSHPITLEKEEVALTSSNQQKNNQSVIKILLCQVRFKKSKEIFDQKIYVSSLDFKVIKRMKDTLSTKLTFNDDANKIKIFQSQKEGSTWYFLSLNNFFSKSLLSLLMQSSPRFSRQKKVGPNCYNFALVFHQILKHHTYTAPEEMNFWLNSSQCRLVKKNERLQQGDFLTYYSNVNLNSNAKSNSSINTNYSLKHVAIYLTEDLAVQKNTLLGCMSLFNLG